MTDTTKAEKIAAQIKAWDKQDADDLIAMLMSLEAECKRISGDGTINGPDYRTEDFVDLAGLPSADIPKDVDTLYPVWAMDADGNLVVGLCISEFKTMTLAEYRENKAA